MADGPDSPGVYDALPDWLSYLKRVAPTNTDPWSGQKAAAPAIPLTTPFTPPMPPDMRVASGGLLGRALAASASKGWVGDTLSGAASGGLLSSLSRPQGNFNPPARSPTDIATPMWNAVPSPGAVWPGMWPFEDPSNSSMDVLTRRLSDFAGATAPNHPGLLGVATEAGRRGLVDSTHDVADSGKTIGRFVSGQTAFQDAPSPGKASSGAADYVGELLQRPLAQGWRDPNWWAAHIAHGSAKNYPGVTLGAVGAGLGSLAGPGPGTAIGAGTGFALGSLLQTLAPAYQRARADGLDHDAAVKRALAQTGVATTIGAAMGAIPGIGLFGRNAEGAIERPIADALAKIFGVQPGLAVGERVADNAIEGKLTSPGELATTYAESLVPGALVVGAHGAARRFAGRPAPAAPNGGAEATIDPGANTAPDPAGLAARTGGFAIAPGERADIQGMLARDVPPEEIAAHPAIRRAVEEEQSRPRTSDLPGYGTPEFRAAREFNFDGQRVIGYDTAIERLANQARDYSTLEPAQQNRLAVIVLGAPASGKSTLSEKFAHDMRAAIVDSDDAKKAIPEFNGGIGSGAVQNESSAIGQEVLKKLTADGTNIVIPRVGTDVADIRSRVQELRGRGYSVALAYVDVAKDTAYRRMIGRFLNTGRIIPADYFDQVGKLPRETYLVLKEEGHFYDTAQFDANGPQGTFRRVDGEP